VYVSLLAKTNHSENNTPGTHKQHVKKQESEKNMNLPISTQPGTDSSSSAVLRGEQAMTAGGKKMERTIHGRR